MRIYASISGAVLGLAALAAPASAAFTAVDISSYVNTNVDINPGQLPIGTSTGNTGTGILFNVAASPNNSSYSGVWLSNGQVGNALTVSLSSFNITGQASFYALLNNYYGTPNINEYDITIETVLGQSVTYQSIGGVDTRDYNDNFYTNTISNTTTEWYNNGIGQRYDVRSFALPVSFLGDTIKSFTITQAYSGAFGDNAIFAGLSFSDQGQIVFGAPEPITLSLFGAGLLGAVAMRRRAKAKS